VKNKISAVLLSFALMVPASSAFAKKHSRTRGTVVGAVAGALIGGPKGAVVGAALGNGVQYERHHQYVKKHHHR